MGATAQIARLLTPPLCINCAAPCPSRAVICPPCETSLRRCDPLIGNPSAHLDLVWSCASHDGVARDLVTALKFRRLTSAAGLIAERIAALAPAAALSGTLVPVPPAPLRMRWRGFDSAAEIAVELSRRSGLPISECLRRRSSRRQVGRARSERIALPPRIHICARAPGRAILVDDVVTTGATLKACAEALRHGGSETVGAVTFARRL